jgi:CO/xanthine dehydrogenase Mo-binding subunit/aerobic-type carbon monoxide dehydrogenase small subunit (CoxS/CutS family)
LPPQSLISLNVNGLPIEREVDPSLSLLRFLRQELGLVGAKNGCEKGACGACTVIIDGEAKRSCLVKVAKLQGSSIVTIEGLSGPNGELHPIQRAFVEEGAVQCGFCTPGMVLATKALLDRKPDPNDADIAYALRDNLCRCTGYQAIWRAVHRAAKDCQNPAPTLSKPPLSAGHSVGIGLPRSDAPRRAKGESLFAEDIADRYCLGQGRTAFDRAFGDAERYPIHGPERPLYGSMLFSSRAHAKIMRLDASKAEAASGVARVLVSEDVPGRNAFGLFVPQQPVIAGSEVMYLGDVVAVVLAESREEAEAARLLVEVEYEDLPVLDSAEANLEALAPLLHPETGSNVVHETHVRKGDIEAAFAGADLVVEGTYDTPAVEHAYLEPESCLALPDEDGGVTIYTGNQGSTDYQDMIAASLGLPNEKARVVLVACGGAFGGKEEPTVQIQAALGAMLTKRPVRMSLSREESIRMSTKRHPMRIHMAHAASSDGKLLGLRSYVVADAGAYVSQTPPVVFRSAVTASGPYEIGAIQADSYGVYTHRNPSGAFRGFGSTQAAFACEVQMDEISRELGIDPIELRRRSAYGPGKRTGTGQLLSEGADYLGTLEAAAASLKRMRADFRASSMPGSRLGFGVASSYKNVGIGTGLEDSAGAIVGIAESGRILVRTGSADMGQGSDTIAAQIAADAMSLSYELFDVIACDTRSCPDGGMTTASRQTFVTGNAVREAALVLGVMLAPFLERMRAGGLSDIAMAEAALRGARSRIIASGRKPEAEARYVPPRTRPHKIESSLSGSSDDGIHYAYCFASAAVAIEVSSATGAVRVLRLCLAQDAGRAINPLAVRGQIEGAAAMGLGYALSERFESDSSRVITDSLRKLGVPRIADIPPIEAIIVETPEPEGPYGAKGMGEVGVNPIAPAVSNAIFDSVGVRMRSLPMTKEKILVALAELQK